MRKEAPGDGEVSGWIQVLSQSPDTQEDRGQRGGRKHRRERGRNLTIGSLTTFRSGPQPEANSDSHYSNTSQQHPIYHDASGTLGAWGRYTIWNLGPTVPNW